LNERYQADRLHDVYRHLHGIAEIDQSSLGTLLAKNNSSRRSPVEIESAKVALPIRLNLASYQIGDVGEVLVDLDIEIRRAASYIGTGTTRPLRERSELTLLGTNHTGQATIFVSVSGSICRALTERPLDLVLATSWFWEHRLSQTKYRSAISEDESTKPLDRIMRSAMQAVSSARLSVVALRLDAKGQSQFEFRPRELFTDS
jgi:hypothetical protein